eukprot:1141970-Pelagomonas_calceolata.AAC.8
MAKLSNEASVPPHFPNTKIHQSKMLSNSCAAAAIYNGTNRHNSKQGYLRADPHQLVRDLSTPVFFWLSALPTLCDRSGYSRYAEAVSSMMGRIGMACMLEWNS